MKKINAKRIAWVVVVIVVIAAILISVLGWLSAKEFNAQQPEIKTDDTDVLDVERQIPREAPGGNGPVGGSGTPPWEE